MHDLHRITYCSQSRLTGTRSFMDAELRRILARSRANNGAADIGGALLFSDDCFAQVLEGPSEAVERAFERIQRDERHGNVVALHSQAVEHRYFPTWSMAYAGVAGAHGRRLARISFEDAFSGRTAAAGQTIIDLLRQSVNEPALT